jgi:potassium efflux system protein
MLRNLFFSFIFLMAFTAVHAEVSQLLRECETHFQAKRLTSGSGGTALDCYKEVLTLDPNNAKALAGLEKIEATYLKWAKRALNLGQKDKVEGYLASLRLVNPDSQGLAELEAQLYPNRRTDPAPSEQDQVEPQKTRQIVDIGQIYEAINTTDCLKWPSAEIKEKAGKNAWGSFYPKKGDTGIVIDEIKHCHFDDNIYLLQIGSYYVPLSSVQNTQPETSDSVLTVTQEWIEKRQRVITEAQSLLEKENLALPTEEQALSDKIEGLQTVEQITPKMLEKAEKQLQAANQKVEALRLERQTVQTHLDKQTEQKTALESQLDELTQVPRQEQTLAQNQRISEVKKKMDLQLKAIELDQQYLELLKKQSQIAIKLTVLAIEWQTQLQLLPQRRLIKEREQAIADGKTVLARHQESLEKAEEDLPNQMASLKAVTFDKLSELFEKAALDKDSAEVEVNNLLLERQNAEALLEKLRQSLDKEEMAVEELRKTPSVDAEQQAIHDKKVAEQEARLEVQKKKLELDKQDLDLIGQRLEQAKQRLELATTWHEKLQAIYPEHQKQALEQQMLQKQQRYLSQAAALRWQLNKIAESEENLARRELLSLQIQQANEQAQQVVRQFKQQQRQEQLTQWEKAAQALQESKEISDSQLENMRKWIGEYHLLSEEIQDTQSLLLKKMSVLEKQQRVVEKRGETLSGKALKSNKKAQKVLAKFQTTLQQELDQLAQLQEKGKTVLTLLETVYKDKLSLALSKPRQLPTNAAEWQSLLKEVASLPQFFFQQLQLTGRGLLQAFGQTPLQRWGLITLVSLIWVGFVLWMSAWFARILSSGSETRRFIANLLPAMRLWRMNTLSLIIVGVLLLLLWFSSPTPLSVTVILIFLLTWFVGKLLINLVWLWLNETPNRQFYRQLRRGIVLISLLAIITALVHLENEAYVVRLSIALRDLVDSGFMILLVLTVLPLWRVRQMILSSISVQEGYWFLVISLITLLIPALILVISILGVVGYINLGWSIAEQLSFFLLVLVIWLIVRGIVTHLMNLWKNSVTQDSHLYELWREDVIPLVHKVLGVTILVLAIILFFWLTGGLFDVAVKDNLMQLLSFSLFTLGDSSQITVGNVLLSILIIWAVFWFGSWFRGVSYRWIYLKIKDLGLRNRLSVFTQYAVIILGLFLALKVIGIDPTALAVFAGAIGLGIGFGLQNIVNNFFSGILLLIQRPFRMGDLVKISSLDNLKVAEINWLDTRFVDGLDRDVIIPNSSVLGSEIINHTSPAEARLVCLSYKVYLDPKHPPEQVKKLLSDALSSIDGIEGIGVVFLDMNEWAAVYRISPSIRDYTKRWAIADAMWNRIWEEMKRAGIQFGIRRHEIYTFDGDKEIPDDIVPAFSQPNGKISD